MRRKLFPTMIEFLILKILRRSMAIGEVHEWFQCNADEELLFNTIHSTMKRMAANGWIIRRKDSRAYGLTTAGREELKYCNGVLHRAYTQE